MKDLALKPDAVDQGNQALLAVNNIYNKQANILYPNGIPPNERLDLNTKLTNFEHVTLVIS